MVRSNFLNENGISRVGRTNFRCRAENPAPDRPQDLEQDFETKALVMQLPGLSAQCRL